MSEAEPDDDDDEKTDSERAEVRRWEKLIEAWLSGGSIGDQGEKLIEAWLTGRLAIGDREARELERRLGLEPGWLDNRH